MEPPYIQLRTSVEQEKIEFPLQLPYVPELYYQAVRRFLHQ